MTLNPRNRLGSRLLAWPLAIAGAWLLSAATAPAKAQAPETLTLKTAFESAVARLPEARGAAQRREAADAQWRAAGSWTPEPPSLDVAIKSDRFTGNDGGREYMAGLSAPIWLPGQRDASRAVAQADQTAVDRRLAAARWRTAAAVREAWWQLRRARIETEVAEARLQVAQQLAADVTRRVQAGDLARADQHQADGAVAAARAELAASRVAQSQAMQALRAWIGPSLAGPSAFQAEPEPRLPPDAALSSHPLLSDLSARAESARRARELAALQRRANPELVVAGTVDRGLGSEPYAQWLTVGVRIPFGSDDRYSARIAAAGAEQTEAEAQLQAEQERLTGEIESTRDRWLLAVHAADAAAVRARLAREAQGFYDKSFRLGETDLPTRLRIAQEAFEAERQSARASVDAALALSLWRQALGLMPE
jgi:cobalt-zinc-cadmium efflux system outer membrane protein